MTREEITKATKEATKGLSLGAAMRFRQGVAWALNHLWHDAQGDDLPEIDREVIVIDKDGKVSYGHRPDPNRNYIGKSVISVIDLKYNVVTYGKGGWNIPDIRYWLDLDLPNLDDL